MRLEVINLSGSARDRRRQLRARKREILAEHPSAKFRPAGKGSVEVHIVVSGAGKKGGAKK